MTRHKHADLIIAWANGAEIQIKSVSGHWIEPINCLWDPKYEYRIKPEREYPKSSLSDTEIDSIFRSCFNPGVLLDCTAIGRIIADAAVNRYIKENENENDY